MRIPRFRSEQEGEGVEGGRWIAQPLAQLVYSAVYQIGESNV